MSIHELSEMVELTAEFAGMKVCKVPLGTFAGTQYRLIIFPKDESRALDTGDQGGGQN
jgi:hypothetical protein